MKERARCGDVNSGLWGVVRSFPCAEWSVLGQVLGDEFGEVGDSAERNAGSFRVM